ncbi:MAG: hypothetical protein PHW13_00865 [Methylococcales bacterium]|nr:hypothetical protein [Methylococcales bacterium]
MKLTSPLPLALTCSLLSSAALFQPAFAISATPASQDELRIHTSMPNKTHDSLFSYTVEWRMDDGELYRSTGISFLNAARLDSNASTAQIGKKLVSAMKDGMVQLDPNWRGVTVTQPRDQPEIVVANKAGFSVTTVTVRDYSNQALSYDLNGRRFNQDGVQIAIDLVYAADVEYLEGFTSKKAQSASQGEIDITVGDQKPVRIKTDGKTSRQLEEEIARSLSGSHLSDKPLYEGMVSTDTRNNKPFDGGEVQLPNVSATSITIGITDPALGVLTKFRFKDENHSVKVIEPRFMLGILGAGSLLAVVAIWYRNRKKQG